MRIRFSLRWLLITFTLVAILFGAAAHFVYRVKEQVRRTAAGIAKAQELGGSFARRNASPPSTTYEAFVQGWIDRDACRPATEFTIGSAELVRCPPDRVEEALDGLKEVYGVPMIAISVERLTLKAARLLTKHPRLLQLDVDCETVEPGAEAELGKIQSLMVLSLNFPVSDDAIEAASKLPKLKRFSMNSDALTDKGVTQLMALKKLESLELIRSENPTPILEALADHPSLVRMEFWECSLDDNASSAISKLRQLKHFQLFGGHASSKELISALAHSGQLETLTLSGLPQTSKHGVSKLAQCRKIEYIDAQCLQVTGDDLLAFKGMPKLKELDFSGEVPSEKVEALLRETPKCTLHLSAPELNVLGFRFSSDSRMRYRWNNGKLESKKVFGSATFGGIR